MKKFTIGLLSLSFLISCSESKKEEVASSSNDESKRYDEALADKLNVFQPLELADTLNPALVKLGHSLYFDNQLSRKQTMSCNTCHNLSTFGVDNQPTSKGEEGKFGDRNSPTTLNAAIHTAQFWDGRAATVEEQAGMPILNPIEMNIPNEKFLIDRLKKSELYQKLFKEAFPNEKDPITYNNLKKAIGAFERKLITPSRFDEYLKGNKDALTVEEKKGLLTFITTGCTTCHNGAGVGGNMFQKFAVYGNYWDYTKSTKIDSGKVKITKLAGDRFVFKVPSLRNIEKTYPYYHDGNVNNLEDAVKIMAKAQLNKDLTEEEVKDIVTFLKSLTADIPAEYKSAPVLQ
ncbi:MAG: cytochrome-c peroxidase [Bacteroidia bacterium]|nr:MAG: cytochrome-c peroxidase [Bacteroidia bacterium]